MTLSPAVKCATKCANKTVAHKQTCSTHIKYTVKHLLERLISETVWKHTGIFFSVPKPQGNWAEPFDCTREPSCVSGRTETLISTTRLQKIPVLVPQTHWCGERGHAPHHSIRAVMFQRSSSLTTCACSR